MNIQITIWLIFVFASLINSVLDLKTMHISLLVNYLCLGFTVFLCVYQKINIIENIISGILLFFIFLATRKLLNNGLGMGDVHYSYIAVSYLRYSLRVFQHFWQLCCACSCF